MTVTLAELPPPIVLRHDETLHAILLPPLATFLSTLHKPEHLLKLNDILDRYRTPKSYHRIDVRQVDSSEIPAGPERAEWLSGLSEKERGEPVILSREVLEEADADLQETEGQTGLAPTPPPTAATIHVNGDIQAHAFETTLDSNIDPSLMNTRASPDTPTHPAPPSAPKRRLRELRVDIRTLDAAALFSLETWRREELGLERLDMHHPASIWYKEPTPTPPPTPPPEKLKKKVGRPSTRKRQEDEEPVEVEDGEGKSLTEIEEGEQGKSVTEVDEGEGRSVIEVEEGVAKSAVDVDGGEEITSAGRTLNGEPQESYSALAEALQENGAIEVEESTPQNPDLTTGEVPAVADTDILAANEVLDTQLPTPGPSVLIPRTSRLSLSPSPDIIIDDAYDVDEITDPDFVPLPRPTDDTSKRRRSKKRPFDIHVPPTKEQGSWTNPVPIRIVPRGSRIRTGLSTESLPREISPDMGTRSKASRPRKSEPIKSSVSTLPIVIHVNADDDDETISVSSKRRGNPRKSDPGPGVRSENGRREKRMILEAVELPTLAEAMRLSAATRKNKQVDLFLEKRVDDIEMADAGDEWGFLRGM
ncbi:hypothetical protein BCR39DRAFT_374916 [Naematelia encephala]|uniref:Uncharacterized protein n=1 Tax=Naematelia encephala TaxID=71784 RepID=A0A1Y2BCM7_9TREE|nr:hypothetical protein BCR39DRAFT_374916 [Naematelia encephala]